MCKEIKWVFVGELLIIHHCYCLKDQHSSFHCTSMALTGCLVIHRLVFINVFCSHSVVLLLDDLSGKFGVQYCK